MLVLPSMKQGATLLDLFKMFPETSKPLFEFHEALLGGSSPFAESERELIARGVTQPDAETVFAEGWNETALYHTVAVTALFNFMNRLVEGLGIELDPAYVKPAADRLAGRGYLPLIAMLR
jgi:hypothetical protein